MKWTVVAAMFLVVSGCTSHGSRQDSGSFEEPEVVALQEGFPPQVWSGHKKLNISEAECSEKGTKILHSLRFTSVVKSSHGEYVYGNHSNNRAAIKCVSVDGSTFVYAIVAGPTKSVVEKLRNEVMWQF